MITRRNFLKKSATALAGGLILPSFLEDNYLYGNVLGANDRINVGLIGCRSMGWGDLQALLSNPQIDCIALCDIDQNVLKNRGAELTTQRNKAPQLFGDYRKMLDNKDIDAVMIGTPDHWHCLQLVDACKAGKDVYVEKPLANSIAECDVMVKAAKKYNRVVQVGQQQRSGKLWHDMKDYIDSGKLGKIAKVNVWANFNYASIRPAIPDTDIPQGVDFEMWLGPAPQRSFNPKRFHGSWRMFWDYGGGLMTDWGVHLMDMALWGMNVKSMPNRVMATGGNFAFPDSYNETFDTLTVIYEFDDYTIEWSNVAGTESGPYGRNYGIEFKGTNGTLVANRESWEVYPDKNKIEAVKEVPEKDDRVFHTNDFVDCMKKRDMNTACTIENGSLCAKYAHLGNIAARTKTALVYDDKKHTFNNSAANELIKPEYRKPWQFPKV
ncbi:MAG: Gfo/Idh/MocA family oxidoreductase [Bacteroidales bacterium]|nr:Gfo/Idh/MocA family oxidoreductase [Bacteroidales bacterium]